MLRVMIPGGGCARFDAVALNAYKGCPALDQQAGDLIYDDDDVFNVLSASRLAPCPPNAYSPKLVQNQLSNVHACRTSFLTYPSQPFITCSCASPHLFLRLKDESTIRPISKRNCISLWASRTTSSVAPGRQMTSPLLPSTVQYSIPAEQPSTVHLEMQSDFNDGSPPTLTFELAPLPLTPSF
jgi:hypothetical protein